MAGLLVILKHPMALILAIFFSWLSVRYLPSAMLLIWLALAVFIDLITGLLKAWSKGETTTSNGLRKTIVKIGSYVGTIVMVIILVNVVETVGFSTKFDLTILIDTLLGFMVFIELYSICENIEEAYPNSPLTLYMMRPILKFLKGRIKDNPITSLGKNDPSSTETNRNE